MKNLLIRSGLALALLSAPAIALAPSSVFNLLTAATATITGAVTAGKLVITGSGSTGDASGLSVTAQGGTTAATLASAVGGITVTFTPANYGTVAIPASARNVLIAGASRAFTANLPAAPLDGSRITISLADAAEQTAPVVLFQPASGQSVAAGSGLSASPLPLSIERPVTLAWSAASATWQVGGSAPSSVSLSADFVNGAYSLSGSSVPLSSLFTLTTSAAGRTYTDSAGIVRDAAANTWRTSYDTGPDRALLGTMVETYQQRGYTNNIAPSWRGTAGWASTSALTFPSTVPGLYPLYQGANTAGVYKAGLDAGNNWFAIFGNAQGSFYTPYTAVARLWIPTDAVQPLAADISLTFGGTNWSGISSTRADMTKRGQWQTIHAVGQQLAAVATASASVSGGALTGAVPNFVGLGYASVPTVTVSGCTTAPAVTAILSGTTVVSYNVTSAGSGCTAATTVSVAVPTSQTINATVRCTGCVAGDYVYITMPEIKDLAVPGSFIPVPSSSTVLAAGDTLTPIPNIDSTLNGGTLTLEGVVGASSPVAGAADLTLSLGDTAGQGNALRVQALGDPVNPTFAASALVGAAQVGASIQGGAVPQGRPFRASLAFDDADLRLATQDGAVSSATQSGIPADIQRISLATASTLYLRNIEYAPGRRSNALLRATVQTNAPVSLTANASAPGSVIPSDFVGISFEASAVQQSPALNSNAGLKSVLTSLKPNLNVRFGGNTSDSGTFTPATSRVTDAANFVAGLGAGSSMIWGLNWQRNDTSLVASQASLINAVLGPSRSIFQIGNEPNYYSGATFASYQSQWQTLHDAVAASVSGARFAGPDTGQLLSAYESSFAANLGSQNVLLTKHIYPSFKARNASAAQKHTITTEFTDTMVDGLGRSLSTMAAGAGLTPRMTEMGLNPTNGVGNTLGQATWALYAMLTLAQNGWAGVNWHWTDGGITSPSAYTPAVRNADGSYTPRPLMYAMVAMRQLAGGTILGKTSTLPETATGLTVLGTDGVVRMLIANRHPTRALTVNAGASGYTWSAASVSLLTGPSYLSTSVTLGGATIGVDGAWSPSPISVAKNAAGAAPVVIPASSAALIALQ